MQTKYFSVFRPTLEGKVVSHTERIKSDCWRIIEKKCVKSDYMDYEGIASYTVHLFKRKLLYWKQEELFSNNPKFNAL